MKDEYSYGSAAYTDDEYFGDDTEDDVPQEFLTDTDTEDTDVQNTEDEQSDDSTDDASGGDGDHSEEDTGTVPEESEGAAFAESGGSNSNKTLEDEGAPLTAGDSGWGTLGVSEPARSAQMEPVVQPKPAAVKTASPRTGDDTDDYSAIQWEINRAISENLPLHEYEGYTAPQLRQIRLALREGRQNCVGVLTRRKYNYIQMELLRKGFEEGLNISTYSNPELNANQMWEIMEGLRYDVDVSIYANPNFSWEQMAVLRESLIEGVDPASFADPDISPNKMQYMKRESAKRCPPLKDRLRRAYNILKGPSRKKQAREVPDY